MAKASLNGVGVRGLFRSDLRIFGVWKEFSPLVIFGVLRVSRAKTGVDVCVGRVEIGVDVPTTDPSLAAMGLLKNWDGEKGRDLIGVLWGVLPEEEPSDEPVVLSDEPQQSSRCFSRSRTKFLKIVE